MKSMRKIHIFERSPNLQDIRNIKDKEKEIKNRIRLAIRNLTREMFDNVQGECLSRFSYCQEADGW